MEENTRCFNMASAHKTQKASEDKKLELRLGPPGETFLGYKTNTQQSWSQKSSATPEEAEKVLSFPWLSSSLRSSTFHREAQKELQKPEPSFLQSSEVEELQYPDKMACSTPASASFPATTDGTDSCHKRCALAPVVGWPPIRSFRKNIASSSISKMVPELPNKTPKEGSSLNPDSFRNDLFVKINMEGVPIGRKINLKAYDSYDKLSVAIDELFRGFLPAQRETGDPMSESKMDEAKENESSVSGSREYTLVYEDNEGDRVLVGDVPWHMFVSTARRLRVLKSTEKVSVGVNKQEKTPLSGAIEL
ncbi:hypothetical protein OIU77_031258 [Salix suchowensis]|uniref:Auxin-responsive protein n=1 Tax=Salix suchowensis TaxID=1278906 RepID=A0ABQ9BIE6_9ROSI|nr:hypothetical protein OIU77_031258 [Salix suchowensis]